MPSVYPWYPSAAADALESHLFDGALSLSGLTETIEGDPIQVQRVPDKATGEILL